MERRDSTTPMEDEVPTVPLFGSRLTEVLVTEENQVNVSGEKRGSRLPNFSIY